MFDPQEAADVRTLMAKLLGGSDGYPSDAEAEAAFRRLYDALPPLVPCKHPGVLNGVCFWCNREATDG